MLVLFDLRTGTWASDRRPQHGTLTSLPSGWPCRLQAITRKPRADVHGPPLALLFVFPLQGLDQSL